MDSWLLGGSCDFEASVINKAAFVIITCSSIYLRYSIVRYLLVTRITLLSKARDRSAPGGNSGALNVRQQLDFHFKASTVASTTNKPCTLPRHPMD